MRFRRSRSVQSDLQSVSSDALIEELLRRGFHTVPGSWPVWVRDLEKRAENAEKQLASIPRARPISESEKREMDETFETLGRIASKEYPAAVAEIRQLRGERDRAEREASLAARTILAGD